MNGRMAGAALAAAALLAGCAATAADDAAPVQFDEGYTPTGSLIPRKTVDRDGKQVVLSREQAQKAMQELQQQSGAVLAK